MSDRNFSRNVSFGYDTDSELVRKMVATMEKLGWRVICTPPSVEMVTVGVLASRVGRSVQAVSRSLHRKNAPIPPLTIYGSGTKRRRILEIPATEKLIAFLKV